MKLGERVLLKQYKNGNKLWGTVTWCAKCEGTGKVIWTLADHRCFDCNGKGWYFTEDREYTPENLAKREAKLAKERAKWEAEEAERAAYYAKVREEEERREAERLAEIERNRGQFIGKVGDRIQMEVTFIRSFEYTVSFGWQTTNMTGYIFKTDDGNTLVWKTSGSGLYYDVVLPPDAVNYCGTDEDGNKYDMVSPHEGERITIKGTIKDHQEYRNVNQTILNRVKWIH